MSTPLDDFWAAHDWVALERVNGWVVSREGERVRLSVLARDGERYLVQLGCDGYPATAPSTVFINEAGSARDKRAWPVGTGKFHEVVKVPDNCFLCMPLTREGLAHHPDWKGQPGAWNERSSLLDLFNYLRRLLNGPDYAGRGA